MKAQKTTLEAVLQKNKVNQKELTQAAIELLAVLNKCSDKKRFAISAGRSAGVAFILSFTAQLEVMVNDPSNIGWNALISAAIAAAFAAGNAIVKFIHEKNKGLI